MKIAYFDCFSGISGDMIIGSLLDSGLDFEFLKKELAKLDISGYRLTAERVTRSGIAGIKFNVDIETEQPARNLFDINTIIMQSSIDDGIKTACIEIFRNIAEAEAQVHDEKIDEIHFHEIGAIDAIIDVAGAAIGIAALGIEKIFCSPVNTGSGFVKTSHGILPVPAPATAELLRGIPVYSSGVEAELATPTGAAIAGYFADDFCPMPKMKITASGYGAGSKDLKSPNLLRLITGESIDSAKEEKLVMIESNIDDMNPEFYEFVMERLFESGALDVYITPVIMKRSRPGSVLNVLCETADADFLSRIIFSETTTSGVRQSEISRIKMERKIERVETPFGTVGIKIIYDGDRLLTASPEFKDCAMIAREKNISLKRVYDAAKAAVSWKSV